MPKNRESLILTLVTRPKQVKPKDVEGTDDRVSRETIERYRGFVDALNRATDQDLEKAQLRG